MNVNYYCDELISEIVMKFEETQEQFIFQTISDFTSNVYQIEIDKQELIDAITLIRKSRGADIIFKDPKIRLGCALKIGTMVVYQMFSMLYGQFYILVL